MNSEIFPKDAFKIFINCLETKGYVIDCKAEQGYSFTSTQLDNMTSVVFKKLIKEFSIDTEFNYDEDFLKICKLGDIHGAYYMIFNDKILNLSEANKILNDYIDSLTLSI